MLFSSDCLQEQVTQLVTKLHESGNRHCCTSCFDQLYDTKDCPEIYQYTGTISQHYKHGADMNVALDFA